jgi:hypothetical protein
MSSIELVNIRDSEAPEHGVEAVSRYDNVHRLKTNPHLENAMSKLDLEDDAEVFGGEPPLPKTQPSFTAKQAQAEVAETVQGTRSSKNKRKSTAPEIRMQMYTKHECV